MHYPAMRDDLINYARSQCEGSDHPDSECERVVQILSQLPDREYRRPTDVSKAFGELARNYLERVPYPAGRDDLVASAREQGADDLVLDTIIMIPSQEYRNPDAVIVEIETSVLGATWLARRGPSRCRPRDRIPVFGQGTERAVPSRMTLCGYGNRQDRPLPGAGRRMGLQLRRPDQDGAAVASLHRCLLALGDPLLSGLPA
jgi:hypothetical protein